MDTDIFTQPMLTDEEKDYLRKEIESADIEIKKLLSNLLDAPDRSEEK